MFLYSPTSKFLYEKTMKLKIGQGESGVQGYNSVIILLVSIQLISKKKIWKIENSRAFFFWKMICPEKLSLSIIIFLARIVCREKNLEKNDSKFQQQFVFFLVFSSW